MLEKTPIPLVRLNLALPFVRELDRRGLNTNAVLATNGLVWETMLDSSIFVPPVVINRLLESAAEAANDPYLGVCVGESLDWSGWPPMMEAAKARNLAGFLIRFIHAARTEASSAHHELEIGADFAVFREKRSTEQEILPSQNDAFTAAFILGLLRRAAGPVWDAGQVRLTVCDTKVLPDRYQGVHIFGGDPMGVIVRFPSTWLLERFNRESFFKSVSNGASAKDLPRQFLDALEHVIIPHLGESGLNLAAVAGKIGVSPQSLQRKLRMNGTTLSAVIRDLKRDRAIEYLLHSEHPVGDIASSLGFNNATSFTRAFKTWTGVSPREYRKKHYKA